MSGQSDQLPTEKYISGSTSVKWGALVLTGLGTLYTSAAVGVANYVGAGASAAAGLIQTGVAVVTGWFGEVLLGFQTVGSAAWSGLLSFVTAFGPAAGVAALTAVLAYYGLWSVVENA